MYIYVTYSICAWIAHISATMVSIISKVIAVRWILQFRQLSQTYIWNKLNIKLHQHIYTLDYSLGIHMLMQSIAHMHVHGSSMLLIFVSSFVIKKYTTVLI